MSYSRCGLPSYLDRSWWEAFDYPSVIWDQHFGMALLEADLHPSVLYEGYVLRSRTRAAVRASGESEIKNCKDIFRVKLNVKDFHPEELKVRLCCNHIIITGMHGEKSDECGSIERKFERQYVLPEDSDFTAIKSSLCGNGILSIEVPKKLSDSLPSDERVINIVVNDVAK